MRSFRQALVALALLLDQVTAISIASAVECPIPYIIPRAFETTCDPIHQLISEEMSPTEVDTGAQYTAHPSQFIATKYIRTTPDTWTHEPWCIYATTISKEICVYTSSAFAKGRGVSFVVQVEEEPFLSRAEAIRNQRSFDWPSYANPLDETRMEKVPIPGKGLGVRSKMILRRGDAAQSFTPVLAVQDSVMQIQTGHVEQNLAIMVGVHRLPESSRKKFVDLWGHFGGNPYYDKINTNAFNALIGKSTAYFWSVYPETSRYNHDCRPNTMYSIESNDLLHNLRVAREIQPGEEITLSYLAPNMRSADRKTRMESQWGFQCSCSLCTAPAHVVKASDDRITLIESVETELNDLSWNRTADVTSAELLISLYEQERLHGVIGDAYMYAAFENAYLGEKRVVQKYAALAIEHMAIWRGTSHNYFTAMVRMLYTPETEKAWLYFEKLAQQEAEEAKQSQSEKSQA